MTNQNNVCTECEHTNAIAEVCMKVNPAILFGGQIKAEDIVRVLPKRWMMKFDAGIQRFEFVNMHKYNTSKFENQYIFWKVGTLYDQEDSTIGALYDLLVEKKEAAVEAAPRN